MERVAFLIDDSGERIDCLLNPETVEVTRLAGVRPRGTASGQLTGAGLADDPLQFTGGGRTEPVLEMFSVDGSPRRSWLRLKLVRVAESAAEAKAAFDAELAAAAAPVETPPPGTPPGGAVMAVGDGKTEPGYSGVRFDLLTNDALGSPLRWRLLAEYNQIANPFEVPPGTTLGIPEGLQRPVANGTSP